MIEQVLLSMLQHCPLLKTILVGTIDPLTNDFANNKTQNLHLLNVIMHHKNLTILEGLKWQPNKYEKFLWYLRGINYTGTLLNFNNVNQKQTIVGRVIHVRHAGQNFKHTGMAILGACANTGIIVLKTVLSK